MNREDFFLTVYGYAPTGECNTLSRLKNLTAEEAKIVEKALDISGAPYGVENRFGRGSCAIELLPESKAKEKPERWLILLSAHLDLIFSEYFSADASEYTW